MRIPFTKTVVASLVALIMVAGCKKVNFDELSKITISGNSYQGFDFNKTYEAVGGAYMATSWHDCPVLIDATLVQITLDQDATLWITLLQDDFYETIHEDSYSVIDDGCEVAAVGNISVITDGKAIHTLYLKSGTITVKEDEGTFDIDINTSISVTSGGGKLKGNFTGTIVLVQP